MKAKLLTIANADLRLPADHPLLGDAIEAATRMGRFVIWAYTGPVLLTALVPQSSAGRGGSEVRLTLDGTPVSAVACQLLKKLASPRGFEPLSPP
jgi:hypothetical protein